MGAKMYIGTFIWFSLTRTTVTNAAQRLQDF